MKNTYLLIALSAMLIVSCTDPSNNKANQEAEEKLLEQEKEIRGDSIHMPPVKVSWNELEEQEMKNGTPIIMEGYVGPLPGTMFHMGEKVKESITIYPRRNQSMAFSMTADIPIGSEANTINELPESYTNADLVIRDKSGTTIKLGDHIRLTGTFKFHSKDSKAIKVAEIERIEEKFNDSVFKSATELTEEIIADTSIKEMYCYMDGTCSVPFMVMSVGNYMTVDFKQQHNKELKGIRIKMGTGPGTMDALPSDYTAKDFIIRDVAGNPIKFKKKIRVYGVYNKTELSEKPSYFFRVEEVVQ